MKALAPVGVAAAIVGVVAFLALPSVEKFAAGRKAKAVVVCEAYYPAGPVHVHGDGSTGQSFEWSASGPFVVCDGHGDECKCCVLQCCQPGVYTVRLTVKQTRGSRYSEDTAVRTFQVGGTPPGPQPVPPGPTPPPPGPQPGPIPDGKFGLTRIAHDAAMGLTIANRKEQAFVLANELKAVAARVTDQSSLVEVNAWALEAFNKLGSSLDAWMPAIRRIQAGIAAARSQIKTGADIRDALLAIVAGLERVQ